MTQEYTPVTWVDETENQVGTVINKARLDQMQTAHHYADGFREVDEVPSGDPGVDYHMVVYCTADTSFYRWDGTQWTKDIDDPTAAALAAHEADHNNPHVVTKAQVGLGNVDNKASVSSWQTTPDNDHIPTEKLVKDSLDAKLDDTQLITSWGAGDASATDSNIPSAKLTKDTLNTKVDDTQIVSAWQATPDDTHIPSEKLVHDTDATAVHKAGAETITGAKTFMANVAIGVVGDAKNLTQVGNFNITGDVNITGNITQNGSAYETHAEQIFSTKDYINLREGQTGALASGSYSGLEIIKYDGTNNGRIVIDNAGTLRVGDVGDEQPLLTRDESADMTDGALLRWNGTDLKAETNTVTFCRKYSGSVTVATTAWAASGITAYPYKADITISGITANDYALVSFASTEASSGNYDTGCDTAADTLTIYARATPSGSITITYMIIQDVS